MSIYVYLLPFIIQKIFIMTYGFAFAYGNTFTICAYACISIYTDIDTGHKHHKHTKHAYFIIQIYKLHKYSIFVQVFISPATVINNPVHLWLTVTNDLFIYSSVLFSFFFFLSFTLSFFTSTLNSYAIFFLWKAKREH